MYCRPEKNIKMIYRFRASVKQQVLLCLRLTIIPTGSSQIQITTQKTEVAMRFQCIAV